MLKKQARTRRNFTETFLWGLVKSVPIPTKSAARCLTHPVLTLVPAPPAQPLLLSKPISLLLSMWFAEARHSWLAHTLAALLSHPCSSKHVGGGQSFRGQYSIRLVTSDQQQGPGISPRPFPKSLDGQGSHKDLGGRVSTDVGVRDLE